MVATKGGTTHPERRCWKPNGRPEHLRAACERSLKALGVERIDLYQLHSVDPEVPYKESVGAVADLRAEGKVRWVGICNVSYLHVVIARRIVPIQTVQNPLNPFFQSARHRRLILPSLVSYCAKRGIGFLAYSPLGGSGLNKRLPDHAALRAIAERRGVSAHAVVLSWLLAQGPNVIPIPAARTVEHALDSIGATSLKLTDDEIHAIDGAKFPRE